MKKILVAMVTLFMFTNVTNANEEKWQEEKLEGENVETQYRYKFYIEEKEGDYLKRGITSNDYEYEDSNDIVYGEYSDYQKECPIGEEYEIEKTIKYEYQELLPVQYIKIINTSNEKLKIKNISIYNLNTLLLHEIDSYANSTEGGSIINPGGSIVVWMPMSVMLRQFSFIIEVDNSNLEYEMILSNSSSFKEDKLVASIIGSSDRTLYKYDDSFKLFDNYTAIFTGYDLKIDDFIKVISEEEVCRSRTVMTYRYNLVKNYYDNNYYIDNSFLDLPEKERLEYKKDLENYKIYYRYTTLNNNIVDIDNDITDEVSDSVEDSKDIIIKDYSNSKLISNNKLSPVNTGVVTKNNHNYKFLILFLLSLALLSLFLIKRIKNNVERK